MRRTYALALTLTLFSLSAFSLSASAQEGKELETLFRERLKAAAEMSVPDLLEQAGTLSKDSNSAALSRALDQALTSQGKLSEHAQLFAIAGRMHLGEYDHVLFAAKLTALVASKDDELAQAAAALLGNPAFRSLKEREQEPLLAALTTGLKDANRPPAYRLECATSLHAQGHGEGQRDAHALMVDFLHSSDAKLKSMGALALASLGDFETASDELERLALLPSDQGRLAAAYLKQDEIRRLYDRKQKNLLKQQSKPADDADSTVSKDLKIIDKLIKLIETTSLEGDKYKRQELIDAACDGMMRSLDEHSSFMPPKTYKAFEQDLLSPEYGGIGAYVGEDLEDHLFTITRPIYSGPAYHAGLHSDDKIVRIDDWPTVTNTGSQPTEDIIKRLKGKPGTTVKLYIWRRGMDPALIDRPTEEMAIVIARAEITIPPVSSQMLPGKIGLIELSTFSKVASEALAERIKGLQAQGLRGVILDLRNDSGGLLSEAGTVANLFLPKGKLVVRTESRTEDPRKLYTRSDPLIPAEMPVAVLINRFSASASEIVSGALQDYQRATLVGQRSFGKGSVQELLKIEGEPDDQFIDENGNEHFDPWEKLTRDWNGNGEFDFGPRARMTMARYLLPSGRSIHREIAEDGTIKSEGGVTPDIDVKPRRFEAWKGEEMFRLTRKDKKIRDWVEKVYPANKELFKQLAEGDGDDTTRYPGFEELYNSLGTMLPAHDVRFLVRAEVRRRVQDDKGAAFPDGDYQEDPQLQAAIKAVLEKLGSSWQSVDAYARTFELGDKDESKSGKLLTANINDVQRTNLRHALSLIDEAKTGGKLDRTRLEELQAMLQSVLDK